MTHPLQSIQPKRRPRLFGKLLIATIALMVAIGSIRLQTEAAPLGIVSLELAATKGEVERIFRLWGQEGKDRAELSIWLDFPYLVLYSTTLALACVWIAERVGRFSPAVAQIGVVLAWLQWLAAALDAGENVAMLNMLLFGGEGAAPRVAFWCALWKFVLVGFGLAYVLSGFIATWAWNAAGPRKI